MQNPNAKRRTFLKTASGLMLAPAMPLVSSNVFAQDNSVVVGTWGGDYQNLLQKIVNPLTDSKVVFDGAALGQYLFGQDPFHTNGQRISGFVNQETDFDASEFTYSIRTSQNSGIETAYIDDVEILNLHIHSKLELPPIGDRVQLW